MAGGSVPTFAHSSESEPGSISADQYNAAQAYIAAGTRYSLICCEYWIARLRGQ